MLPVKIRENEKPVSKYLKRGALLFKFIANNEIYIPHLLHTDARVHTHIT